METLPSSKLRVVTVEGFLIKTFEDYTGSPRSQQGFPRFGTETDQVHHAGP
jgi:hypothetical protein